MASGPPTHDPTLQNQLNSSNPNAAGVQINPNGTGEVNLAQSSQFNGLDQSQIMTLLRALPNMGGFAKGDAKDSDAAQTLANFHQVQAQQSGAPQGNPFEAGPSSHPRGPPNLGLGQLSALASQSPPLPQHQQGDGQDGGSDGGDDGDFKDGLDGSTEATSAGGRKSGRNATMGSEEWTRQRKDNHKEVERRRRGNINDGINELGRIVPNGSGEKAKGAILSRAVQYIHHLKENEARNIEKWTLEKLLMDQAMGDLQAQLEEMRRLWEEERGARQRCESELTLLRGGMQKPSDVRSNSPEEDEEARGAKRQRVE